MFAGKQPECWEEEWVDDRIAFMTSFRGGATGGAASHSSQRSFL